ncbi:MAG: hypothetical protein ACTSYX_02595 [Candidatus Thorarchaeota archaeon]
MEGDWTIDGCQVDITIPIHVSETPVRESEKREIKNEILKGNREGILHHGTISQLTWKVI